MTHGAGTARIEGRSHKGLTVEKRQWKNRTRDDFIREIPKAPKFENGLRAQQKCNNGIRKKGLKQQSRLGEQENAQQEKCQRGPETDHSAGGRRASSWVFHEDL
jgi:hypothetical protein